MHLHECRFGTPVKVIIEFLYCAFKSPIRKPERVSLKIGLPFQRNENKTEQPLKSKTVHLYQARCYLNCPLGGAIHKRKWHSNSPCHQRQRHHEFRLTPSSVFYSSLQSPHCRAPHHFQEMQLLPLHLSFGLHCCSPFLGGGCG